MTFAEASAVHRQTAGTWTAYIQPGWDVFGSADGGYLMAMASRAMSEATDGRIPASVTTHFLRPGKPGPVVIEVEVIRSGRSFSTARADVRTDDRMLLTVLGVFADRERRVGDAMIIHSTIPDIPPPDECFRMLPAKSGPLPPPFMANVDERLHPDDAESLQGERTGIARIRGWIRLLDDEPMDVFSLLLAADAFPPAVFNTNLPLGWTPTIELTTHIRGGDPTGWLRCQFRTRFVTGGFLEEDGEIWDADGRLVAQSRQLALVPAG